MRGTGTPTRRRDERRRFIPARAGNSPVVQTISTVRSVHPRSCGEQGGFRRRDHLAPGSSPLVRGTVDAAKDQVVRNRFIPARAGNSSRLRPQAQTSTVHPRSCGEQDGRAHERVDVCGSSPLVRGTVLVLPVRELRERFIPARAGNSRRADRTGRQRPVHPRSCGEQFRLWLFFTRAAGSSPLVRGTGPDDPARRSCRRFIPARAGNRQGLHVGRADLSVHPRSCGEQRLLFSPAFQERGSSPLVRGTDQTPACGADVARFIPARAGNRPHAPPHQFPHPVHPRSCGEQRSYAVVKYYASGSSPLVRGTARGAQSGARGDRFIPARAGNSRQVVNVRSQPAVHPRSCGEQGRGSSATRRWTGSSPLVRGTEVIGECGHARIRFIPARAGNRGVWI